MATKETDEKDPVTTELAALKSQRSSIKRNITNIKQKLERQGVEIDEIMLECRLQILESYFTQICHIQSKIEQYNPNDTARSEVEELFITVKTIILRNLKKGPTSIGDASVLNTSSSNINLHHNRLPTLKLPKFNGKYADYKRLIATYNNLVDNDASLSSLDKFNYLLNCLSSPALNVVESFQVTDENYAKALARLKERFDNKVLIFLDNINGLLTLGPMSKANVADLRYMLDHVSALRGSLLSLGSETDIMNAILIHLVLSKVDAETKSIYERNQDFATLPSWDACYKLLSRHCQYLETTSKNGTIDKLPNNSKPQRRSTNTFVNAQLSCLKCNSTEHTLQSCPSYISLSVAERFNFVKQSSLCINCLRKGHMLSKCMSTSKCRSCNGSHHTTLHRIRSPVETTTNCDMPFTSGISTSTQSAPVSLVTRSCKRVLLPTAIVLIKDKFGTYHPARALLDSCSEINFITEQVAKRLQLAFVKTNHFVSGIANIHTNIKYSVAATMKSQHDLFEWNSDLAVTKSISADLPDRAVEIADWKIPQGITLADPLFYKPQRIDLLLSANIFFELLTAGKLTLGKGLPHLINTRLGWKVGGQLSSTLHRRPSFVCNQNTHETELTATLRKFWEIEDVERPTSSQYTEEELACEQHFVENTLFCNNGRVVVRLPFKGNTQCLGQSLERATSRFLALERRLERDNTLKTLYVDFMEEYRNLGHMSPINNFDFSQPHYVIPHHGVLKPQSTTTKLRAVFDESASTTTNISLNELLMVGPTIQQDLITTLLAFRLNKYALTADIQKMYRQFIVHEHDRNFQLILWRKDSTQPLNLYQLNTVTYGMSSAPFLAIRSLSYIADSYASQFPMGSSVLKTDLYVDDLLTGAHGVSELKQKNTELIQILSKAGLCLAKWNSNHNELINEPHEEVKIQLDDKFTTKALGMTWKPRADLFCFRYEFVDVEIPTKRSILSATARIFDLLGLLSPIVIRCKMLLQEIWLLKLDWDEPLPSEINTLWSEIKVDLEFINNIEIPRYVFTSMDDKCDIHGFADASERAYGCCIYVRCCMNGEIKCTLLIAKSKVAPLKAQSLPRLELCAAVLLSRTWHKFKSKLIPYIKIIYFWTDSKIVLQWITMHSSKLNCFVANKVSELQDNSIDILWRHVPSQDNPADIVSRGARAHDLVNTIWYSGPAFLLTNPDHWPRHSTNSKLQIYRLEMKTKIVLKTTSSPAGSIIFDILNNHSSYHRILRITSYVFRIFNGIHPDRSLRPINVIHVSHNDLQESFYRIISFIQHTCFHAEILCLRNNTPIKSELQRLTPFLHEIVTQKSTFTILRVGGRLANASIPFDAKFPALLPKDHRFTRLYIEHLHRKHLHAGEKVLLSITRMHVWIVNAREIVRKVVRQCTHCFHYKPRLLQQIMGNLPADRLKSNRPFLVSDVDLCGPFFTSYRIRGKPPYKTYIAIFVCFSTKVVHIELTSDSSTNTFILCLKRFIARRGIPQRIYCDNATNFVGANNHLRQFCHQLFSKDGQSNITQFSSTFGLEFNFIPPRAPHFGGLWEAAVKSTKTILLKNISNANLTFEELQTVAIEVEAILNSRPMTTLSSDPNDGEVITPAHFLIGDSLLALPEYTSTNDNPNYLSRFQNVIYLKHQFWEIWRRDYIHSLQVRSKWLKAEANIRNGQLVIIHEDNLPPQQWLLGRVVNIVPGQDGRVRVVDVKTTKGCVRRPIHKLAPVPNPDSN